MKKLFLLALLVFTGVTTYSQSYGIKAGLNISNLKGNDSDGFDPLTSYHVGVLAELKVFDNLAVQPELLYSIQGAEVDGTKYELGYISLPIMAKFYLNGKLSFHFGPQFGLLVSDTDEISDDSNTFDYGLAGGLEYRIAGGLFVQGRYGVGLGEISKNDDIKNSVYQLSLGYIF